MSQVDRSRDKGPGSLSQKQKADSFVTLPTSCRAKTDNTASPSLTDKAWYPDVPVHHKEPISILWPHCPRQSDESARYYAHRGLSASIGGPPVTQRSHRISRGGVTMDRTPMHRAARPVTERAKLCPLLAACPPCLPLLLARASQYLVNAGFLSLPAVALEAKQLLSNLSTCA